MLGGGGGGGGAGLLYENLGYSRITENAFGTGMSTDGQILTKTPISAVLKSAGRLPSNLPMQ